MTNIYKLLVFLRAEQARAIAFVRNQIQGKVMMKMKLHNLFRPYS